MDSIQVDPLSKPLVKSKPSCKAKCKPWFSQNWPHLATLLLLLAIACYEGYERFEAQDLRRDISELRNQTRDLGDSITKLNNEIYELKSEATILKANITKLNNTLNTVLDQLNGRIHILNDSLNTFVEELNSTVQSLRGPFQAWVNQQWYNMNETLAGEKQLNDSLVYYISLADMVKQNISDFEKTWTVATVSEIRRELTDVEGDVIRIASGVWNTDVNTTYPPHGYWLSPTFKNDNMGSRVLYFNATTPNNAGVVTIIFTLELETLNIQ